ncbi:MAG: hypothetical protein OHK0044_07130 [Burkholderiaceae bacterium]
MRLHRAAAVAWALAGAATMAASAGPDPASYNGFDVSDALIPLHAIERGGPPKDGIPAIDRPKFTDGSAAGLRADDRVLGLVHNGVTKAYPVRILNWHEVVNDRFGDAPVAVTYCPLCGTGIAFDARHDGQPLNFGVSGLLYNSDVLLYDRGTESLWSQLRQQAVTGRLKGARLNVLPLEHTTWADWQARHPTTLVLSTDTGFARDYWHDPYAGYDRVQRLLFSVEHRDERLAAKEWVLGIAIGDARKAYPFSVLSRIARERAHELRDTVGGQVIYVRYDPQHRSAQALDAQRRPLPAVTAFWFAWVAFNPNSEVYRAR